MPLTIKCKKDFYRLAALGLCGNTARVWHTLEQYWPHRKEYPFVGVRRTRPNSKDIIETVHHSMLGITEMFRRMQSGTFVISEVPRSVHSPSQGFQGELTWGEYAPGDAGWILYYTNKLGYMRTRLEESGQHLYGARAWYKMKSSLLPREYEEIVGLFNRFTSKETGQYPVIEFAVLSNPMGINNQHLVIWEIRNGY